MISAAYMCSLKGSSSTDFIPLISFSSYEQLKMRNLMKFVSVHNVSFIFALLQNGNYLVQIFQKCSILGGIILPFELKFSHFLILILTVWSYQFFLLQHYVMACFFCEILNGVPLCILLTWTSLQCRISYVVYFGVVSNRK